MFIALGAGFLIQLYIIWLTMEELDKRFKNGTSPHIEMDKYFHLMINELGMTYYEAEEEYNKIETYSHLILVNRRMEKFLKKEKAKVYA